MAELEVRRTIRHERRPLVLLPGDGELICEAGAIETTRALERASGR